MARRELVAACSLIGALGGALFAFVFVRLGTSASRWAWEPVVVLSICTAISATLLGLYLARKPRDPRGMGVTATLASFCAGAFNGVLTVFAVSLTRGGPSAEAAVPLALAATIAGAVAALFFIPAVIAVSVTSAVVDARPGTVVERSQRRRVLRVAALSLAIASVLLPPQSNAPLSLHLPLHVMGVALAVIGALFLFEVAALASVSAARIGSDWEPSETQPEASRVTDLGVGLAVSLRRAHDETYRRPFVAHEILRGDPDLARIVIRSSLRGHGIAFGITVGSMLLQIAWRSIG